MYGYGKNQFSWMEGSKRISGSNLSEVLSILDEAYWILEQDDEVLKEADKIKSLDPAKAKELIYQALFKIEEWKDAGLSKIDSAASDLEYEIAKVGSLKIDVHVTPEIGY